MRGDRRRARSRPRGSPTPTSSPARRSSSDAAIPAIAGLHDPALAETKTEAKVELAQEIERACRATDDRVAAIEQTVYADEEGRVAIASSGGLEGAYEATSCYAYLPAIAGEDGDRETGLGFGVARAPGGLDAEEIGAEARRARHLAARRDEAEVAHLPGRPRRDRRRELHGLHRRRAVRRRRAARPLAVRRQARRGDRLDRR